MPKSKPKPDRLYVDFLVEQFSPLGEMTDRFMMGGWCLYCDGIIFGLVADGALYLKGDDVNIPRFTARGLKPFQPFADQPMTMKYFQTPPEVFEDPAAMRDWVGSAIEAGRRAGTRKKKAK